MIICICIICFLFMFVFLEVKVLNFYSCLFRGSFKRKFNIIQYFIKFKILWVLLFLTQRDLVAIKSKWCCCVFQEASCLLTEDTWFCPRERWGFPGLLCMTRGSMNAKLSTSLGPSELLYTWLFSPEVQPMYSCWEGKKKRNKREKFNLILKYTVSHMMVSEYISF